MNVLENRESLFQKLSEEQKEVIKNIQDKKNLFISGEAGTGKSFILKNLHTFFPDKKIILSSTTGVSSFNLGGITIYSFLSLGLGKYTVEYSVKKILATGNCDKIDILVIDEISMLNLELFEKINKILQIVKGNDNFFGGIQIITTGDFFQLPNVEGTIIFNSIIWKEFTTMILKNNFRQEDDVFKSILNRMRKGENTKEDISILKNKVTSKIDEFCIFPTNDKVKKFNDINFKKLNGSSIIFTAKYNGNIVLKNDLKTQFISKNIDKIVLKENCRVMLLKNIDIDKGLVNGSMGTVKKINKDSVDVLFDHMENFHKIEIIKWSIEDGISNAYAIQIPLCVAYGSTIHKTQGLTLNSACMDLENCFCNHQVYVALSRVKKLEGLKLISFNPEKIKVNKEVIDFYEKYNKIK